MAFMRTGFIIAALLLGWGALRVAPEMMQSAQAPAPVAEAAAL